MLTLTVWLHILACSKSCFWDCVLYQLTGKYHLSVWQGMWFLVSLIVQRLSLLLDTVLLGFGFKLSTILWKSMQTVHRQGAGIRLEGEKVSLRSLKITTTYMFILSLSRFCPSLTGLLVCDGEEHWAMAEMTPKIISCVAAQSLMTLSLQVDLVLSDMAATVSHNLFS